MPEKPLIFFLHVPKTAGASLNVIFQQIYGKQRFKGIYERNHKSAEVVREYAAQADLISSHLPFGIHEGIRRPVRYVTMLRNPVSRLISNYYFAKGNPNHFQYKALQNTSLEDGLNLMHHNLQVKLLAGKTGNDSCDGNDLETAKHNLETWFDAVGLTERFDDSIVLFYNRLNWSTFPRLITRNVTKSRPKEIAPATYTMLQELNALDMELYEYSTRLMDRHIRELGSHYQRDLSRLNTKQSFFNFRSAVKKLLPKR